MAHQKKPAAAVKEELCYADSPKGREKEECESKQKHVGNKELHYLARWVRRTRGYSAKRLRGM